MRAIHAFLVVLFALGTIGQQENTRILEDAIVTVTECIRRLMVEGVPELGIPSFEPLQYDQVSVDLTALGINGLSGYVGLSDIFFNGVTDFDQTNVVGSISIIPIRYTVSFTLTFPVLDLNTGYDLDVTYEPENVNIYGAGQFSFEAINFSVDITATVGIIGGVQLTNFGLWPSLEGLNSLTITGLYNDEEYSASLTETILANPSGFVAEYAPLVDSVASSIATDAVNNGGAVDAEIIDELIDRCVSRNVL